MTTTKHSPSIRFLIRSAIAGTVALIAITLAGGTAGAVNGFPDGNENAVGVATSANLGIVVSGNGGDVATYGQSLFWGQLGGPPAKPVVGIASSPSGNGYWQVASDGGVFANGDAGFYGSAGGINLNAPVVGMAPTPDGKGYWLVAADGGIFAYGDAGFYGSAGGTKLNAPMVGMASSADGKGYWLVAADGGIFAYGDAPFRGSAGGTKLNAPIVGMAASQDGNGYWLVAADGGIFAYGDAVFYGSAGGLKLNAPVVGMSKSSTGQGYWLVASDGGLFAYGNAASLPYRGRVLSTTEETSQGLSIGRDVGQSVRLASGASLWVFGDTSVNQGTFGPSLYSVIGGTSAMDPSPVAGSAPTNLINAHSSGGTLTQFLPPASLAGCTSDQAVAWPNGLMLLPGSTNVLVTFGTHCNNVPNIGGYGAIIYSPTTHTFSAPTSTAFFSGMGSSPLALSHPVLAPNGDIYLYGGHASGSSNGTYLARVPAGLPADQASSYQWFTGTPTSTTWNANSASAVLLPGTSSIAMIGLAIQDFGPVLGSNAPNRFIAIAQTQAFYGNFTVLHSSDGINWSTDYSSATTGCIPVRSGTFGCYAIEGHPDYSNSQGIMMSWWDSNDVHLRMTQIPY